MQKKSRWVHRDHYRGSTGQWHPVKNNQRTMLGLNHTVAIFKDLYPEVSIELMEVEDIRPYTNGGRWIE